MRASLLTTVLAGTLITAAAYSQDSSRRPDPKQPARTDQPDKVDRKDTKADKAKMEQLAQPGPEHKNLDAFVGTWTITGQCWEKEGAPEAITGTCSSEWVLGNRFVKTHVKSTSEGKSFEGIGLCGYDTSKRQYASSWHDTMTTAIMTDTGTYDTGTKTFTFTGEPKEFNGEKVECRRTVKINNDNEHVMTFYLTKAGQPEMKASEMTFKRTGAKAEIPDR